MVGRAVSPHPDPLPQGKGTARIAQWKADGSGMFSAERRVHPLPKGEGWGEGKEHPAPRGADALALAYGQCPQRYTMALRHSRFQAFAFAEGRRLVLGDLAAVFPADRRS